MSTDKKLWISLDTDGVETPLLCFMKVPGDLNNIYLRSDKVWNFDEIGFNIDEKCQNIVYTYKWCVTDKLWKTQVG